MGVLTRRGHGRRTELAFTTTSVVLGIIPDFLVGVVLVYLFGVNLGWLPVAGQRHPVGVRAARALAGDRAGRDPGPHRPRRDGRRCSRPTSCAPPAPSGCRRARIYLGHALPNALTASLTLGGLILSAMVAGTVLVENVFAWPGLGSTIVSSILNKDYQLVQAIVLVYGAGVLLVNTVVDVALALLDPRSMIRED